MSKDVRYVVSQIEWAKEFREPYFRRTPRSTPIDNFRTFEAAEFTRARLEFNARRTANPFVYGGESLFYQTHFDAPRLHDWLLDGGIEPPAEQTAHNSWVVWWELDINTWTSEQFAHAWAAMHKICFYEITEETRDTKAYVVIELNWTWHDEPRLYADHEGGNIIEAYRSRSRAEAACNRLNAERQRQREHLGFHFFRSEGRVNPQNDGDISQTVFFEVVEITVEGEE
jgi:hypothetical protein